MAGAALLFAGASSALDLMGGLFGYLASGDQAAIADSRARMIRMEAEADAQRYAEQAESVSAQGRVNYLKSGVLLTGSPLDVLDHDMLVARENISAIRSGGEVRALDQELEATQIRNAGRMALINGITGSLGKVGSAGYQYGKNTDLYNKKNTGVTG